MGAPGWTQILIVAALALLLFGGRGKISAIMGDLAKGITSFRKGLKDDDQTAQAIPDGGQTVDATAQPAREKDRAAD